MSALAYNNMAMIQPGICQPWPTTAWLWHNLEYISLSLQKHGYRITWDGDNWMSSSLAQPTE